MNTGRKLNREWGVAAAHSFFSKDGTHFHKFKRFPGALFDPNGYVRFRNRKAFEDCSQLQIRKNVHAPEGISNISGYVRMRGSKSKSPAEKGVYLLTWNPKRSSWDGLNECAALTQKGELVEGRWSCGNNKSIETGSGVFLLRQGTHYPGIVGSGSVYRRPYRAPHWDEIRRLKGHKGLFVKIRWNVLTIPRRVLSPLELKRRGFPENLLKVASSGVRIPPRVAARLEKMWARHYKKTFASRATASEADPAWEGTPVEYRAYRRKRDRKLVSSARAAAMGICAVCETDYSKLFDGDGACVLQVHHKRQLGYRDRPRLTKTTDLAVLCANCHRLVHVDPKKAIKVGTLRSLLKKKRHQGFSIRGR